MAVHHLASRGPRLAALLRGFGLCPVELAREERRVVISALKGAYKQLAKEQHPDRVPEAKKVEAAQKFVHLRGNFEEAVGLLEQGIRPVAVGGMAADPSSSWQQHGGAATRPSYNPPVWEQGHRPFQHREPVQFDLQTRIKGNLIFWSSLFVFLTGLREFLVWSAGSQFAWIPSTDLNPFWVRRFKNEWAEESKDRSQTAKKSDTESVKQVRQKQERGLSNFYQKRGISNVRRKTEPRGLGPSI